MYKKIGSRNTGSHGYSGSYRLEDIVPTQINNCYVSIYLDQIKTIRDKDSEFLKKYDNIPRKVKSTMEQPIFNIEDK